MGLFSSKNTARTYALFDIDSASVGGAIARIGTSDLPTIYFTARSPIQVREHEDSQDAMLRTLAEVSEQLISQGGPTLRKETGSGHIDKVIASIGAPWQLTNIRIEAIEEKKQFVFTDSILSEILRREIEVPEGYIKSTQSVIATLLNGYETPKPVGKKAIRADVYILSSLIDKVIAKNIEKALRKTYHTHALTLTAFASVSFSAFRNVYPHEKDFILLDVTGESTTIEFIQKGLLIDVVTVAHGRQDEAQGSPNNTEEQIWIDSIKNALQTAGVAHTLPPTIFLLANPDVREYLRTLINSSTIPSLWLTDDPLRIIAVSASHFSQFVRSRGVAEADLYFSLLALFVRNEQKK